MEVISHIFLVFFYCLSGAVIIIYLLFQYAINRRLRIVRMTIRSYRKRARAMAAVHDGLKKLNEVLTEKERADVNVAMYAVKVEFQEESADINTGVTKLEHEVSSLEYKSRTGSHIAWPPWAKRKLQRIVKEMQELRDLAEKAPQY